MVDWALARRVAGFAIRSDRLADPGVDLGALAGELEPRVAAYTGLTPSELIPRPEIVSRAGWVEANLATMTELMGPVEDRLGGRFESAGPLAAPLRVGAGKALGAELGLVTGYMSQRVLGQYELSLLAGTARPRLLFVGVNLLGVAKMLGVDRDAFVRWVAVHELTHAHQFGGVPWLRDHIGGLLREYLATVDVTLAGGDAAEPEAGDDEGPGRAPAPAEDGGPDGSANGGAGQGGLAGMLDGALERVRGIDLPDPAELAARYREGGLAALVQNEEQRELMDRMQAAMAVVEGHAEHVMDALGPELVPEHASLRAAMDARRASRSAPERVLLRLLGMEMKLRQYKLGKSFCDTVVADVGIDGLNRVWDGPDALPSLEEIERPADWLARVGRGAGALGGESS